MDAKHTPGPWLYHKETNQVHVKNGATVAEVTPHYMNQIADGKLIAAAPLLLEALQMAFDRDLAYLSDAAVIPRQDVVRARLAIHAALGVTPNAEVTGAPHHEPNKE
jgi:hypothetical protein